MDGQSDGGSNASEVKKEANGFSDVKKEENGKTSSLNDLIIKVRLETGNDTFDQFAGIVKRYTLQNPTSARMAISQVKSLFAKPCHRHFVKEFSRYVPKEFLKGTGFAVKEVPDAADIASVLGKPPNHLMHAERKNVRIEATVPSAPNNRFSMDITLAIFGYPGRWQWRTLVVCDLVLTLFLIFLLFLWLQSASTA